ncbi:uncharacterized protein UTRI_00709_B [Ustilago trichophora]|uniref:Uncharacterized protein n=1 Tax=Ustilago trichophora TaxID=86804 RepID=A0A5C3DRU9_9BASI|nr:uncharacterized protein UTRI_00709_B [Ustilago trichophora]
MRLTGRLSRQPPWWLLFGVLAYVILFTVSVKSEDEIQPAPEEHVASTSQYHRAPSFQAAEAPPDSRVSRSTSSASFNFPKPPDSFPFSAQPATRAVKPRLTLSGLQMTRWQRLKARLQRSAVKRMVNVLKKYQRFEKRRRAKKFGPRRGEVEIRPVFQYTKEEAARGRPPKPPVLSKAEEIEVFNALSPFHRASRVAFLSTQTSFEPDPEVLAAEIRRQPMIEKARAEKLAAEAHARAAAAGGTGESSRPLSAIEPATNEETASEARVLPLGEGGAGVSIRPLRSTQHAPQVEPSLRSSTSQRVVTLSRTPSSEWDRKSLVKQAEERIQQGLAIINDGLHVEALPRVHLRKRSPPDDPPRAYTYTQKHDYPGQHYRITLVKDPLSRDPMLKEGKLSYHFIDPASVLSGEASMAKYWEDMSRVERKEIHQGVKKIWDRWWNVDYNKEPKRRVMSLPSNANGIRRINVPGKGPLLLRGYHDGYGNWLWEPRVDPKVKQPLVHEDNLPIHLKDFVKKGLGNEPYRILQYPAHMLRRSLPMTRVEKRSPAGSLFGSRGQSDWTQLGDLRYDGEGYQVIQGANGRIQFARWSPYSGEDQVPRDFNNLEERERKEILKRIPEVKKLRANNWDLGKVSKGFRVSTQTRDKTGVYYFSDRPEHTVEVRQKGNNFEFKIMKKRLIGPPRRTWVALRDLPEHMKEFLRWEAEVDVEARLPWRDILSGLRRRSLPSLTLKKRAGPAGTSTKEPRQFVYPSQKLEIRKTQAGYTFSVLSEGSVTQEPSSWFDLSNQQKNSFLRAFPRIDQVAEGRLDEHGARLKFVNDPITGLPLRTKTLPAESVWVVRESSPSSGGRKRLLFLRIDPVTDRRAYNTLEEIPDYLRTWLYEAHRDIYDEAIGPIKQVKRPISESIPVSDSQNTRSLASNSQHAASKQKFTAINFHGNYLFTSKDLDGNYRFSTSRPTSSTKAFDYQLWTTLSDDQKKRVKKAIPNIEGMMSGNADVSRSEVGEVWKNEQKAHLFSDEGPETILVEKKQRWLPWLRPKFIFHRTDPATSRTISSSFKDLPDHLQIHLRESYLQGFKDVINHPLWKRADSPAEIGTGQPVAFHYPGQEVEVRKIAGKYTFGFPSNVKTLQRTEFLPWDQLKPKDQVRVQWAYLDIKALLKGKVTEAAAHLEFEPGENPEVSIARRAMFNDRPRTIWLIRKRHPFLRGREVMQFLQVDPLTGRLAGVPMQKLPFPVQSWFHETHRDVFDEAVESAKTYRLPLWRSAPTSVPSPKPFAPKSKFFRFEFEGQKARIYKLKNEGGYSYGLMDDAYPENSVSNKPWTELSAEQQDKFKTAVPDIEKLVNQEADAENLGLKFKHIGIDHPAAIVPIPGGQEPQSILLEEQKQGWLPFSRRKKLIFHRVDPETSKTISSSMEELPNYLQDYFRNNYSGFFKRVIKHTLKKRADRDESNLMPLLSDHREASSSNWPAQSSNRPSLSSSRPVGAGNMQQLDYPGRNFHIIKAGDKYNFVLPSGIAWNRIELRKWESMTEEQRQMVKERIPEIKRFLDNPTEDAKVALNFQYDAAGFPGLWSSSHSVPGQGKETILLERTRNWLQRPNLVFHRRDPSQGIYRPWSFEELQQHLKDWIEAAHTDLFREVSRPMSGLHLIKRASPSSSDDEIPYHELTSGSSQASSSNQAVSGKEMKALHYPGGRIFFHKGREAQYGFSFPSETEEFPGIRIKSWQGLTEDERSKVIASIDGIEEFLRNPTEEAKRKYNFRTEVPGLRGAEIAVFPIKGQEAERIVVERQKGTFATLGRPKVIYHRLQRDTQEYRAYKFKKLPRYLQEFIEVQDRIPEVSRQISRLRIGKRNLTPGISDSKVPSGTPSKAYSSQQAASRGDREVFFIPGFPARQRGDQNIPGSPPVRIELQRKRALLPPWRKYLIFHVSGEEYKFEELPQFVTEWFRKEHNEIYKEAEALSGIELPRPMEFGDNDVHGFTYPGEEIQIVTAKDGTYKFNFLSSKDKSVLTSRTWSDLPEEVQNYFSGGKGRVKKLIAGKISYRKARKKGVLVVEDPKKERWAYRYPEYKTYFHIGRSTDNHIVVKQVDQYGRHMGFQSKFGDLPELLKGYLRTRLDLHHLLNEAEGGIRRLHKRAPPSLPHVVGYPGKKIVLSGSWADLRKRMLPWRKKKKQYQASTSGAGPSTELEGVSIPVEVDFPMNSRFLPPAVSNPFQNAERPQHFRQFIYPGENGYDVLHHRNGYTFERIDLSQSSVHSYYKPLHLLPTKDQEAIRKLIPNIDEMIKQHTVTPDFVPSRSIHWFRHEAPADIRETKQDGWLMHTVHHLNDGGGYSFKHTVPFDQLPENLQRFIETAKRSGRSFVHK